MNYYKREGSNERRNKRSSAGHGATCERTNHYQEYCVESGRLSKKSFLSQAYEKDQGEIDDQSPKRDLSHREVIRARCRKSQYSIKKLADLFHVGVKRRRSRASVMPEDREQDDDGKRNTQQPKQCTSSNTHASLSVFDL